MIDILWHFDKEKRLVLRKLDFLQESIQNLQYEGKASFQKNMRNIGQTVDYLKALFLRHMDLDDEVIFPFARAHVPRLEVMITFLNAERHELRSQLETFEVLFHHLTADTPWEEHERITGQLKEKGVYVVCVMRNHIQTESEGIYNVLDRELHGCEKKQLVRLIRAKIGENTDLKADLTGRERVH